MFSQVSLCPPGTWVSQGVCMSRGRVCMCREEGQVSQMGGYPCPNTPCPTPRHGTWDKPPHPTPSYWVLLTHVYSQISIFCAVSQTIILIKCCIVKHLYHMQRNVWSTFVWSSSLAVPVWCLAFSGDAQRYNMRF